MSERCPPTAAVPPNWEVSGPLRAARLSDPTTSMVNAGEERPAGVVARASSFCLWIWPNRYCMYP